MGTHVLVLSLGLILLLVAIVGGGVVLKKFRGPKVSPVPRAVAGVMGMLFIGWSVSSESSPPTIAPATRAPSPPTDTEAWDAQLRRQLVDATPQLTRAGYQLTHETHTGLLYTNGSNDVTLTLYGGVSYALVGICDNDCSDLVLVLYDAEGYVVGSSRKPHLDTPLVVVAPDEPAQYRVRVMMAACAVEPCFYGVGVFGK